MTSTIVKDGKLIWGTQEFELQGYRILEALGSGANAEVFLVYNEVLDRNEALKVWHPRKHQISVNKEQFYAELRKNALFTEDDSIATVYTGGGTHRYLLLHYGVLPRNNVERVFRK